MRQKGVVGPALVLGGRIFCPIRSEASVRVAGLDRLLRVASHDARRPFPLEALAARHHPAARPLLFPPPAIRLPPTGLKTPVRRGTIAKVSSRSAAAQHLSDLERLRRVRDRIDREYQQPLDVEALARGVHMSAGHLSRQFRLAYGESPYSYLMTRRIERAMTLLRRGDLSVTEVCFEVGCSSLGTFSTRFTELVGVPPSVYRVQAARATAGMPPCVAKKVTRPIRAKAQR
jgi:AraC-like DNA-binding protein